VNGFFINTVSAFFYSVCNVKVNIMLSMCLGKYLTLMLYEGKWLASCPGCFTPRERAPNTPWIGGWIGSRTNLEVMVKMGSKF
jgi:hypothetical protein